MRSLSTSTQTLSQFAAAGASAMFKCVLEDPSLSVPFLQAIHIADNLAQHVRCSLCMHINSIMPQIRGQRHAYIHPSRSKLRIVTHVYEMILSGFKSAGRFPQTCMCITQPRVLYLQEDAVLVLCKHHRSPLASSHIVIVHTRLFYVSTVVFVINNFFLGTCCANNLCPASLRQHVSEACTKHTLEHP